MKDYHTNTSNELTRLCAKKSSLICSYRLVLIKMCVFLRMSVLLFDVSHLNDSIAWYFAIVIVAAVVVVVLFLNQRIPVAYQVRLSSLLVEICIFVELEICIKGMIDDR